MLEGHGRLQLEGHELRYFLGERCAWKLDVRAILLIGEWMDAAERTVAADAHRLVFASRNGNLYDCSATAGGLLRISGELAERHKVGPIRLKLTPRGFGSRVVWPMELRGWPLYSLVPQVRRGIRKWMPWSRTYESHLAPDVRDFLTGRQAL